MKILVFDDTPMHRKAAELSLACHDLTVVGTYDEAQKALVPSMDHKKVEQILPNLLVKAGLAANFSRYRGKGEVSESDAAKYDAAQEEAYELATTYPAFDVVMTDLMVPASRQAQGPDGSRFVGQEMPLGTTIALLALVAGIKKVAVVTDMNHHNHPASAMFDCFGKCKNPGINIICTNRVGGVAIDEVSGQLVDQKFLESDEGGKKYPYPEGHNYGSRKGLVWGKNWGSILKKLLGEQTS